MAQVFYRYDEVTVDAVKKAYERMNYPLFTGELNVNLFGIRNEHEKDANTFNDLVAIMYQLKDGTWKLHRYDATTDPGNYYRKNLINVDGTAILVPGCYRGTYKIGMHRGQYKALVQAKPVKVYRDKNKDTILDMDPKTTQTGSFGINIHRATPNIGQKSVNVDNWSAGCQVIASNPSFVEFIGIMEKSAAKYGNSFTYSLFTESQFFG